MNMVWIPSALRLLSEYNTVAGNDAESGRMRNRHTQIIITPKLDQFMELIDKAPENDTTTAADTVPVDTTEALPIEQL